MNEKEALSLFSERLDTYIDPQMNFIECACWFADDFSRFKRSIVEHILQRIRNPPYLPTKLIDQPRLPLYYLIDAMCKKCQTDYSTLFGDSLATVFESSLQLNDKQLNDKLCSLVDHWSDDSIFPESVIEKLRESINAVYRRASPNVIQPNQIVISQFGEDPTIFHEENKTEQIIVKHQFDENQNEIQQMQNEEHRYSREWMKNTAEWQTSKYDPNSQLIRDLDVDHRQKDYKLIQMVKVTPENANARCISCSGTFDRCVGPNGEECLKNAIWEEGRGYIHQQCKQYQASDSNAELLRFLLQK